jgi:hypothetical protein
LSRKDEGIAAFVSRILRNPCQIPRYLISVSYSLHQFLLKFHPIKQVPKSSNTALVWHLIYGSLTQTKPPDRLTLVDGMLNPTSDRPYSKLHLPQKTLSARPVVLLFPVQVGPR